jgi:aspartyl-tRNA(Asn)/glutamyl-tRNA(Gln) amidotransferase subunit A
MSALHELSARDAAARVRGREVSAVELTQAVLARARATEPAVGAYLTLADDLAVAEAAAIDRRIAAGEDPGPLAGVPIGLKDVICTAGLRTTAGSRILERFVPPYDAAVTRRLRAAGAVVVGKLNCDGSLRWARSTRPKARDDAQPLERRGGPGRLVGRVRRRGRRALPLRGGPGTGPADRSVSRPVLRVTGRSRRTRVSRWGVVVHRRSTRSAIAATSRRAALSSRIAGHDPNDSTSSPQPVPRLADALGAGVRGLRLGLPKEYFVEGMQPDVERRVRAAVASLESGGAQVVPVSLPHTEYAVATYYLIATAEASSNLARYDGVRYGLRVAGPSSSVQEMYADTREAGFGAEVKRRIVLGTYALSAGYYDAYYLKALQVRTLIAQDFARAFERCDAIVSPVYPTTAFRIGQLVDDPVTMYLSDILTISVNLAGLPGMSVPCGFDAQGLPIGLQLIGRPFDEPTLFRLAAAYERATEWHRRSPIA